MHTLCRYFSLFSLRSKFYNLTSLTDSPTVPIAVAAEDVAFAVSTAGTKSTTASDPLATLNK